MEKSLKKKIIFILPPFILALLTLIWLFYENGRWYTYRDEWEFLPLVICHVIMPVFYLIRLIIATIKQLNVSTRSRDNIFYASLYDESGNIIKSSEKTVKVIEKKSIALIASSKISDTEDRTVDISWNEISNSENTYNYKLYRRVDSSEWQSRSIWNRSDKIQVLNVYPAISVLDTWMNTTISKTEDPAGMGMFDIDSVSLGEFNTEPDKYMYSNNEWKYDVIFFGSWDYNGYSDLSDTAYEVTQKFVDSGRGVLFGHDTLCLYLGYTNFCKFADQLGIKSIDYYNTPFVANQVTVTNIGTITNFPWELRGTLNIPATHATGQVVGGTLTGTEWMQLNTTAYVEPETGGHSNFYLVTNNNLAMIQTGHSNGAATDDERKVVANTLFYLYQTSLSTTAKDNSFYDLNGPNSPCVDFVELQDKTFSFDINSEDNGTIYQYYIDAVSAKDSNNEVKSNILTHTAKSGLKGFVYVVNNSSEQDNSILEYDENNEHILNVINATDNNKIRIDINTSEYDTTKDLYLHVFAVDNEDNVSAEVVKNLGEGKLSPHIETDKAEYYVGDNVKITSLTSVMPFNVTGDVSISLYDSEDKYIEELYGKNNQVLNVDSPYTTEHELALDDSYSGSYKVKIEWTTADAETYSDIAEFSIVIPTNKEDDEKKTDDVHTETDADNSKTDNTNNSKDDTDRTDKDDNNKQNDTTRDNESNSTNIVTNTTEEKQNPSSVSSTQNNPASDKTDKKNSKDKTKKNQPTKKQTESTTEVTTETTTQAPTQPTTQATTDRIPEKPANPSTPSTVKNRTPETGDEINLILLFAIMGISAIMTVGCLIYKKSSRD